MVFSSMVFLWIFLPAVLAGYFLCPRPAKNLLLVFFSLLFYAWGEPKYITLMILSVTVNYVSGRLIGALPDKKKLVLFLCVAVNLLLLGYFKYFNFIIQSANSVLGWMWDAGPIAARSIALPIGISFYTFQALSYVIDVYRGEVKVQKNYIHMLLYVSFFPQLIAGPIVKYHDIDRQIESRTVTADKFAYGVYRFSCGMGKKVLLSNAFAEVVDKVYGYELSEVSAPLLWLAALLYMLQIYFDFSGYSDMAIGLGKMFGFDFQENFNLPYISTSVKEFWRRWHISLSSWFRDYLYIPLGGNRKGTMRTYRNLLIVFFLTGMWHGAGWTFIIWGLFHGLFQILERLFLGKALAKTKPIVGGIYTFLVVYFGWIFFRAETFGQAVSFIKYMFVPHESTIIAASHVDRRLAMLLVLGILFCGPVQLLLEKLLKRSLISEQDFTASLPCTVCCMAMLWLSIMMLINNTYNPFIYFRF